MQKNTFSLLCVLHRRLYSACVLLWDFVGYQRAFATKSCPRLSYLSLFYASTNAELIFIRSVNAELHSNLYSIFHVGLTSENSNGHFV